jgi:hypothetical protein
MFERQRTQRRTVYRLGEIRRWDPWQTSRLTPRRDTPPTSTALGKSTNDPSPWRPTRRRPRVRRPRHRPRWRGQPHATIPGGKSQPALGGQLRSGLDIRCILWNVPHGNLARSAILVCGSNICRLTLLIPALIEVSPLGRATPTTPTYSLRDPESAGAASSGPWSRSRSQAEVVS